jgi:hypothetical protein
VMANKPPSLPIKIFPPAFIYLCLPLWLWPPRFGYRIDALESTSQRYCHRRDKPMNLQRGQRIELALLLRESRGKLFRWILPRGLIHWSFCPPMFLEIYAVESLLEELPSPFLELPMDLFDHLHVKVETCGRVLTKNLLTSEPPCPSNTPNSADLGQFSRKQS